MDANQRNADLKREIEAHLALEASEREADGASPQAARQAALRAFGNVTRTREDARAVWIWSWLQDAAQDLRYATRVFTRTPVFTVGAALILALGIGASTAIFGAINAVILAPLPYTDPDRLVQIVADERRAERRSVLGFAAALSRLAREQPELDRHGRAQAWQRHGAVGR